MDMIEARKIRDLKRMIEKAEKIELLMREVFGIHENNNKKAA